MEEPIDTSTGKSDRVEVPVYPERVRFMRKGKEEGSEITVLYCLDTDIPAPPAVVPVAVTVKDCVPTTLVDPLITPVEELIESPGGSPLAEKDPFPEKPIV
jgi:hypothetical protein